MNNNKQAGFTLIEVLIASAIIMASLGVLLQLFGSGLDRTLRAGQQAHLLTSQRVIVHVLEGVNPATHQQGRGVAEGLPYHWTANIREPFLKIQDPEGLVDREAALFTMTVNVQDARTGEYHFSFDQLGWRDLK